MTDYSAHDIHRLDQAYPDARRDVEDYIGNPAHKRRLAEQGPEVFAAELTRDLATYYSEMSIAGWAAIATVQLMDAGKTWEEDTDAAWAKVDELKAELAKTRAELAEAAHQRAQALNQLHRAEADHQQTVRANTELANERDALKAKLDLPCGSCHPCVNYSDETWRQAGRKPSHVITWDDTREAMGRVAHLADQYEVAGDAETAERIRKALHIPTIYELLDEADAEAEAA